MIEKLYNIFAIKMPDVLQKIKAFYILLNNEKNKTLGMSHFFGVNMVKTLFKISSEELVTVPKSLVSIDKIKVMLSEDLGINTSGITDLATLITLIPEQTVMTSPSDIFDDNYYNSKFKCYLKYYKTNKELKTILKVDKINIISISLFYLKTSSKIKISKYINNLSEYIKLAHTYYNNFVFRIYFDNSILESPLFRNFFSTLSRIPNVQLVKYYFPFAFDKEENVHKGVAGTLARFMAFDADPNDVNYVVILDADSGISNLPNVMLKQYENDHKPFSKLLMTAFYIHKLITESLILESSLTSVTTKKDFVDTSKNLYLYAGCVGGTPSYFNGMFWKTMLKYLFKNITLIKRLLIAKTEPNDKNLPFIYGIDEILLNMVVYGEFEKKYDDFGLINTIHPSQISRWGVQLVFTKNNREKIILFENYTTEVAEEFHELIKSWFPSFKSRSPEKTNTIMKFIDIIHEQLKKKIGKDYIFDNFYNN